MMHWGAERFAEWWDAHQRYRRTRSFGVLFSLAGFWWERLPLPRRQALLAEVGADAAQAPIAWRALELAGEPKERAQRRAQLAELVEATTRPPPGAVVLRGRVWWDSRAHCYAVAFEPPARVVGSIQGDKSARGPPAGGDKSPAVATGPPPARAAR